MKYYVRPDARASSAQVRVSIPLITKRLSYFPISHSH